MQVGDTFRLRGKTRRGRNKIDVHGAGAQVVEIRGKKAMINHHECRREIDLPNCWRWIELNDDPDFAIEV